LSMPNTLSSCRSRRDASEKPTNPPPVTSTIMIHSDDCRRADLDIFSTLNPLVLSEEYGAVITLEPSGVSKKKFLRSHPRSGLLAGALAVKVQRAGGSGHAGACITSERCCLVLSRPREEQ